MSKCVWVGIPEAQDIIVGVTKDFLKFEEVPSCAEGR